MSCNIGKGRTEPCKNSLGGLKNAFFANFDEADGAFTVAASQVTDIAVGLTTVYKWDLLADGNTLEEVMVADENTGTRVNTQTLTLAIKKQDYQTAEQIDLIAAGRPVVIVQDRNDNYKVLGITEGMNLTSGSAASGGAKADFNGYNLTLVAEENKNAPFLDAASVTALLALVDATPIDPDA
jgi:hypothetical protein